MSYTGKGLFTQATSALTNTFTALADTSTGTITRQALTNAYNKNSNSENQVNATFLSYLSSNFNSIDKDGDGSINSADLDNYINMMGKNGMTYEEVATLCGTGCSNSLVNTVLTYFDEIDKNGDGKVTSEEIAAFSMEEEHDRLEDEYGKFRPTSMSVFYEADSTADDWKSVVSKADRNSMSNGSSM